jgi:hypothetical protein
MTCRVQLAGGGDAGDSSADDDDIHDFLCPKARDCSAARVTRGSEAPDAARLDGKTTDPEARLGAPDPKSAP